MQPDERADVDGARLAAALEPLGWTTRWQPEVGSTNAVLLAEPPAAPALLVAESQTAGRGRFDRVWASPRGAGLTFSMLLRPSAPVSAWGWLPLLAGVALASAVRERTGVAAALKWPNDLLAPDGRKLAGILVQSAGSALVVGIGLNVSTAVDELPVPTASSLRLAGAARVDRTELLIGIARCVQGELDGFDGTPGGLAERYADLCVTVGREVTVSRPDGAAPLVGAAVRIADDGALVVLADRVRHAVHAGDVEHVR